MEAYKDHSNFSLMVKFFILALLPVAGYAKTPTPEIAQSVMSWHGPDINGLMTGSAAAGYSKPDAESGSFNISNFNPLFLFNYKDFLLLQSSVNFEIDDMGNTSVSLDTMNLNWTWNDYMTFGIGKFDSSIGKFVPNLGPDWINKLPSAPVGFDGDEAAPQSEVGAQIRGGFNFPYCSKVNYVLFIANGHIATEDGGLVQSISTDGYSSNDRETFVKGGRIGFLPIPSLEIGVSAAFGDLSLYDTSSNLLETGQDYETIGADISFKWNNLDLRGEYIQQEAEVNPDEIVTADGIWRAWYAQAAYRFESSNWEPVLRYSDYDTPFDSQDQRQWAFGIDYWLAPSVVIKLDYEMNEGLEDSSNDTNVLSALFAFGF